MKYTLSFSVLAILLSSCITHTVVPYDQTSYYKDKRQEESRRSTESNSTNTAVFKPPSHSGKCYAKCLIPEQHQMIKDSIVHYKNMELLEKDTIQVVLTEQSQRWVKKKADKNCLSDNPDDCMVWCLVEVPPTYEDKIVLKNPEAAEIESVQYIEIKKLVKAGGYTEWREVICEKDVNKSLIHDLQAALRSEGFYSGTTEDRLLPELKSALSEYQKENGLPEGQLDYETLRSLKVK